MKKIKILFYAGAIDFAGTWRSHERILLNLNTSKFEVYVFYNPQSDNNRLDFLRTKIKSNYIIPFETSNTKLGESEGYRYTYSNFSDLAKQYNFDIIHYARSGHYEWPFVERICPLQIETNIFGSRDNSPYIDYSVAICHTIAKIHGNSNKVIYNPIPPPVDTAGDLKTKLNIDNDTLIFGRIGRNDVHDSIALEALHEYKKIHNKFKYIIIGAGSITRATVTKLNLQDNIIYIETTNDDNLIHQFHNTIDVFLHYRSDGECHSTAISQAMMYGIPIISHYAGYNGQIETIGNGGIVTQNASEYCNAILQLSNKATRKIFSENAIKQAHNYVQEKIVAEWEEVYTHLTTTNNI